MIIMAQKKRETFQQMNILERTVLAQFVNENNERQAQCCVVRMCVREGDRETEKGNTEREVGRKR